MKNSFRGSFLFVVVLLVVFSGIGFAATCTPGETIIGPITIPTSPVTSSFSCMEGPYTFSNFTLGATGTGTVTDFTLSTGPATNAAELVLDFDYTNIATTGDDLTLTFQVAPGISTGSTSVMTGPGVTVSEMFCSVPTGPSGSCSGTILASLSASNGGSASSALTVAGTTYVFKDISGGSGFTEDFAPEPVTFSLMGLGLLAIGFAGRKRLRKD